MLLPIDEAGGTKLSRIPTDCPPRQWAVNRGSPQMAWLLLTVSAIALNWPRWAFSTAWTRPCVMCIYERVAVFGLMLAGTPVLRPSSAMLRWTGYLAWAISAAWGCNWHCGMSAFRSIARQR